ncbi:regulatory protein RecX [Marmoricola sp. OAE513]|uniref:regulatory protein RecX n=1 Tax=Marmoricola sp. OAE513 TaxID=2817894 RepID=UPI00339741F1
MGDAAPARSSNEPRRTPHERRSSSNSRSSSSSRRGDETAEAIADDTDRDLGPEADPESVGRKILLDQLTGRARSRAELAKKLGQKNVPAEIAERLLNRFEEVGLIDDAAFAQEWVTQRQEGKGLARRALAQELRRKGIDDEVARAALDTVETEDEVEAARLLVQRKLRSMRGLDQQVAIRRLVGMLARKGYSSSISFRVVREELDADLNDPEHSGL